MQIGEIILRRSGKKTVGGNGRGLYRKTAQFTERVNVRSLNVQQSIWELLAKMHVP